MSDYDSALNWSHNQLHHKPKTTGSNLIWLITIVFLFILAAWWWWANYS